MNIKLTFSTQLYLNLYVIMIILVIKKEYKSIIYTHRCLVALPRFGRIYYTLTAI